MKKLFLIDAYALIFRFHYAFISSPMRNPEGRNVSAVYGFVKFLYELIDRENPEYLGVAFDPKGGNYRHKLYPEYKANRDATPEDIIYAAPIIKEILSAMCIPVLEVAGYEADDVIGTLSHKACKEHCFSTFMVTPDKDYGQLVNECTRMYKPAKGAHGIEIWGEKEVCEHFGIANTAQVVDILAIAGDSADNIPGVAGIGGKGAAKLVAEFGSVEGIIEGVESIKGKTKEKILASMENLKMSKELAKICLEVPVEFNPAELEICAPNIEELREIYRRHNFRYFMQRLDSEAVHNNLAARCDDARNIEIKSYSMQKAATAGVEVMQGSLFGDDSVVEESKPAVEVESVATENMVAVQGSLFGDDNEPVKEVVVVVEDKTEMPVLGNFAYATEFETIKTREHNYTTIESCEALVELVAKLSAEKVVAFDTETTSLRAVEADLVGVSFSVKVGEAYWLPTSRDNVEEYMQVLRPLFKDENIRKVGQNIKYDIEVLKNYGVEVRGEIYDTMVMHYILDAEGRHSMDMMARNFLGYSPMPIEDLIGKGARQLTMDRVPAHLIAEYASEDADITFALYAHFLPMLEERDAIELYSKIEEPLISVLSDMEYNGVYINTELLGKAAEDMGAKISAIEAAIFETAGEDVNINSPKQLGELLFDKLKLNEKAKKTKTGQYKTDEQTLESLKGKHPIVEQILEYRGLKKLMTTYIEALPQLVSEKTGRVHSSFNQAATATGRLSSSNPNLQNIPIREEEGREIRRAFTAEKEGWVIVAADYSQIELRVMAHLSDDSALIEAFVNDEDVHTATAAKIFGVTADEVTREQRRRAKMANFGIIYGISTFGLAQRLQIPRAEARELIDGYFTLYGGVREYMDRVVTEAKERGYVETIFGRRRYLGDINSSNAVMRSLSERNAINAPIQGSAADIMKLAMIGVSRAIAEKGLNAKVILQVHDEIVIETPSDEVEAIREILTSEMENVVKLSVPLKIDIGVGVSWLDAH